MKMVEVAKEVHRHSEFQSDTNTRIFERQAIVQCLKPVTCQSGKSTSPGQLQVDFNYLQGYSFKVLRIHVFAELVVIVASYVRQATFC